MVVDLRRATIGNSDPVLLNSQPMGFYAPAQLVRDARECGVEVRPVSVDQSYWDCTLEGPLAPLHPPRPIPGVRTAALPQGVT